MPSHLLHGGQVNPGLEQVASPGSRLAPAPLAGGDRMLQFGEAAGLFGFQSDQIEAGRANIRTPKPTSSNS
jgi:hypothetical protein